MALVVAITSAALAISGCVEPAPGTGAGTRTDPPKTSASPDKPAFPTAMTTGVPHGVTLTRTESLTITKDGTVIDGRHVDGRILIEADDVTIRNTLVRTRTSLYPIHVANDTTGTLIENVEVDNEGGTGIGIYFQGSGTLRGADVHSASDGIRIEADDVTITDSFIHDLHRQPDGHHDTIQMRSGDDVTITRNTLQPYDQATDDPMNAAIQIGSLSGDDPISNFLVVGNLMNGGNFTINGGRSGDTDSARYANNHFGDDSRYGAVGNLQDGSVWEDSNVWLATGEPVR